jgi:opacity protein-like surface antigen
MKSAVLSVVVLLLAAAAASAQSSPFERRDTDATPRPDAPQFSTIPTTNTWVSGWLGGYTDAGRVTSSAEDWVFGRTMAAGLGVHRAIGNSLSLGIDASFAPSVSYEIRPNGSNDRFTGNGRLGTAFATGRLRTGGFDAVAMYLTGGAGTFLYNVEDNWESDLALMAGAGLEYRLAPTRALFLEWGRYTVFNSRDGVDSDNSRHSQLRFGARLGL